MMELASQVNEKSRTLDKSSSVRS
uniref:Uncharacterized protein n=1 Tax=Arundo donax TaxID=35708 RepID=A0A0A9CCN2_ARUDO